MDDFTDERWLPVVGWEGLYEVSSLGRVRSLPRRGSAGDSRHRMYGGRILRPGLSSGYHQVELCRDGTRVTKRIYRLVAPAFLGPRPPGLEVCHGPNGALDDSVANLSYGTRTKNMADTVRDGTRRLGSQLHNAKLTEMVVAEIRRRHADGEDRVDLARDYGVTPGTISCAVRRETWRHVP